LYDILTLTIVQKLVARPAAKLRRYRMSLEVSVYQVITTETKTCVVLL